VLRIDRAAVQKNYATMRAQTAAGVRHGAVLKSDAYGLGARPIAEALVEAGCSLFFVADLDAALALRPAFPEVAIVALDGYSQQRASHDGILWVGLFALAADTGCAAHLSPP
jgi:alanine racemase